MERKKTNELKAAAAEALTHITYLLKQATTFHIKHTKNCAH